VSSFVGVPRTKSNTGGSPSGAQGLAIIQEEQAQGVAGGSFNNGLFRTRQLNNIVHDDIGISLVSSVVSIPAGDYYLQGVATACRVNAHQSRIQDITNSVTLGLGMTGRAATDLVENYLSTAFAFISVSAITQIELQHICQSSRANEGFGFAGNLDTEVYSQLTIMKVG